MNDAIMCYLYFLCFKESQSSHWIIISDIVWWINKMSDSDDETERQYKIVLVGDTQVGKTSIALRLVEMGVHLPQILSFIMVWPLLYAMLYYSSKYWVYYIALRELRLHMVRKLLLWSKWGLKGGKIDTIILSFV